MVVNEGRQKCHKADREVEFVGYKKEKHERLGKVKRYHKYNFFRNIVY